MKKTFSIILFFILALGLCQMEGKCEDYTIIDNSQLEANAHTEDVKKAIEAYKSGDYLAAISILNEYTKGNKDNAIAWYYLGIAYMNIALIPEADNAFNKVVALNAAPKLTSYAIQAQLCMQKNVLCKYENFNIAEVNKLKENPIKFMNDYYASLNKKTVKSDDVIQIENLINGMYTNNIHPQANAFIMAESAKIEASRINSGKS